jgi:hypothetical protein
VFAKRGAIDRFVASTASWKPGDEERVWQTVLDVAGNLDARAKFAWRIAGRRKSITPAQFWLVSLNPRFITSEVYRLPEKSRDGTRILSAPGGIIAPEVIAPHTLDRNLVIARGPVQAKARIGESVVLANGNVTAGFGLHVAVIVCDGDVEVRDDVSRSIVVARGNIKVGGYATNSVLVAGGKVSIQRPLAPAECGQLVVQQNVRTPLNFVTFFELSTVGADVKVADEAVRVAAVAEGKAFATAGVKPGNVVAEVNGKKPDSAESLRRLLRDALAIGDATLTLKRGDRTETVKVSLPE